MFKNYLITFFRNIRRHKLYSFINITGLAVGLACVVFVILFVRDELSFDRWIADTQNLYRLEVALQMPGRDPLLSSTIPFMMPEEMHNEIPEVTAMTRIYNNYSVTLMVGDRQFRQRIDSVDPNFFTVIKLPLLRGDPASVFADPQSLVLSESAARKYFGDADPIGKIISTAANCDVTDTACLGRMVSLKVTGVMRDIPYNSQLVGDVFLPNTSIADRNGQPMKHNWHTESGHGYVRLAPNTDPETVIAKMAPLLDRAVTGSLSAAGVALKGSQAYRVHLTPFRDVHLNSQRWSGNMTPAGSWTTICSVGIVGALILLIACFNFMNLATARALLRAREIALRKTLGANRGQLIAQFLGEAVLMALISLALALALVEVLQPSFSRFLQHPIGLDYASDWPLLLAIVAVTVVAGLVSGSYPALMLSGFRPALVLRTNSSGQAGSGRLRASLVVLQFAVSIALAISATVVFTQINYARNIDLGFHKSNVLVIDPVGLVKFDGQDSFTQRLKADPDIVNVATIGTAPFNTDRWSGTMQLVGHPEFVDLNNRVMGPDAIRFLGMKLVAGRLLSDKRAQDQVDSSNSPTAAAANDGHNVLIDESAATRLGLQPQQALGQTIVDGSSHLQIVGVLADAKFDGAREPPRPSIYFYDPNYRGLIMIRIRPDAVPQTVTFVDRAWHDFAPTKAVSHYFLDDEFGKLYQRDERQGEMFGVFVAVAIVIACLGLFGLAAFTAGRRTREIGIRKVFGARTRDLIFLLLWQFSIPVLIANAIAWPVAWYYLHGWLQGFAYHVPLSPLYFIGAGAAAMLIAWITVFTHARRVAGANPIHALRTE